MRKKFLRSLTGWKMNKLFVGVVLVVILVGIGAAKLTFSPQNRFEQGIKEKVGKPTLIQEGVMTEKQKKHSKLFKQFKHVTQGRKLRDIAAEKGSVSVINMIGDVDKPSDFTLSGYLQALTRKSDAVILGRVRSKSSQLLDEGTFTFTDYEIAVTEVLKSNAVVPVELNSNITYTSTGGAIQLNGHIISAVDYRNEPLQVGEDYLLYLKFVPETGAYKGFSDDLNGDTFQIKDGVITQTSKKPSPLGTKRTTDAATFMAEVRTVINLTRTN